MRLFLFWSITSILLAGCSLPQPFFSTDIKGERTSFLPRFFACNGWEDKNQDGIEDPEEWQGIKDVFWYSETVTFVGTITKPQDTQCTAILKSPKGKNVHTEDFLCMDSSKTIKVFAFSVAALVKENEDGFWKMEWYAGTTLLNVTTVKLLGQ
jgi:hypothetical protein